jgi:hypothetical protein
MRDMTVYGLLLFHARSERQHKAHIELTHKPTISERSQELAQEMVPSESKKIITIAKLAESRLPSTCCLLAVVWRLLFATNGL